MALPIRDQAKYWGLALLMFFIALWVMGGVILPFLVGGALAYFLDPVADRLERAGLSRVAATTVITAVGILILVALVLAVLAAAAPVALVQHLKQQKVAPPQTSEDKHD